MAATGRLNDAGPRRLLQPVTLLRAAIIITVLVVWEAVAASGLLYRDVVPRLDKIVAALWKLLTYPDEPIHLPVSWLGFAIDTTIPQFYVHLWVTAKEIGAGLFIGGVSGLVVGLMAEAMGPGVRTVTVGFAGEPSETEVARMVARHHRSDHVEYTVQGQRGGLSGVPILHNGCFLSQRLPTSSMLGGDMTIPDRGAVTSPCSFNRLVKSTNLARTSPSSDSTCLISPS